MTYLLLPRHNQLLREPIPENPLHHGNAQSRPNNEAQLLAEIVGGDTRWESPLRGVEGHCDKLRGVDDAHAEADGEEVHHFPVQAAVSPADEDCDERRGD